MTPVIRRIIGTALLVATLTSVVSASYPAFAGTAADDLKQIEYRYYFRGRYQQTIEALQTFLARVDLTPAETTRAREVLAASYVLGGAPAMGKGVFTDLIVADPEYAGPDPKVFKLEVVNAYAEARAEYTARMLTTVPAQDPALSAATDGAPAAVEAPGKPLYKKWWLYAGAAAVMLAVGVAAAGGDEETPPSGGTGSVVVGVRIQ